MKFNFHLLKNCISFILRNSCETILILKNSKRVNLLFNVTSWIQMCWCCLGGHKYSIFACDNWNVDSEGKYDKVSTCLQLMSTSCKAFFTWNGYPKGWLMEFEATLPKLIMMYHHQCH